METFTNWGISVMSTHSILELQKDLLENKKYQFVLTGARIA